MVAPPLPSSMKWLTKNGLVHQVRINCSSTEKNSSPAPVSMAELATKALRLKASNKPVE